VKRAVPVVEAPGGWAASLRGVIIDDVVVNSVVSAH
jgi:hypothetical protein